MPGEPEAASALPTERETPLAVRQERALSIVAAAVVLGTLSGLIHVLILLVRQKWLFEFTWMSRDVLWMSPVGNIGFLMVAAVPLALVALFVNREAIWTFGVWLLGWIAAFSAILNFTGLHPLAAMALGAGVAAVLARSAKRSRLLYVGAGVSIAVVLALVIVTNIERRFRSPDLASREGAPNVLVLILDTVRAASTSLHGYARQTTPNIDILAREGAVFEWAIAPSAWTLPSHSSMFTGRHASALNVSWRRPLDGTYPTVAELFRDNGYATAAFVGNPFYAHYESGVTRGFEVVRDFERSRSQIFWSTTLGQTPFANELLWNRSVNGLVKALREFNFRVPREPHSDRRRATEIFQEFRKWRGEVGDKPWFAFINLYDAHGEYDPPPRYRNRFSASPEKQDLYDAGIAYMDTEFGAIVEDLRSSGVLDNTIVVVTSDHGEHWGEHGLHDHGHSLYMPLVHVPLMVRYPARVSAQTRVKEPVSLTGLAATLADMAGLPSRDFPAQSLMRACCNGSNDYDELIITETERLDPTNRQKSPAHQGALAGIVSDSLELIVQGDSSYFLFDLRNDYGQKTNLLQNPQWYSIAIRLDSLMRSAVSSPLPPLSVDYVRHAKAPPHHGERVAGAND